MDLTKTKPSRNFEDRTWMTTVHHRLNELFDFLNRPTNVKKSFKDPYKQVIQHARPILPTDKELLTSFFREDTPDFGAIKKSGSKSSLYDLYLLEQILRKQLKNQDKISPMTQRQVLDGGY